MEANQNGVENLDKDYSNRQYQQNIALKSLYTALSNAPHALALAGVRMDAEEQRDFMQHLADAINSASGPAEKARIAQENRSQLERLFPNTKPDAIFKYLDDQAEYEKYQIGDAATQEDLTHELEMAKMQYQLQGQGTAGGAQMEYDLLRELAA